jgi:hypothetical protein
VPDGWGAFEQVGERDAAVSRVAEQLGVAWWTVMDQVINRGTPLIEDSARLDPPLGDPGQGPVRAVGVDETGRCCVAEGRAGSTPRRPG